MGWLPEIGDVVLGKYRVVRSLGQGGMGVVFEAVNVATDGHVALKMVKPSLDGGSIQSSRMSREARASAKLRSRFVARIMDFEHTKEGGPVLVMELLEGRDLSAELRRTPKLPIEEAVSYIVQACAGIGEAHALGIIHRDLKPGNLFLETSSGPPLVRVLDFGLVKDTSNVRSTKLTGPQETLGTLAYMSPEQIRATRDADARSDVWALGVVLWRALMGKLPIMEKGYAIAGRLFDPEPLPRVEREGVSRELVAVIAKALEKDPERRFPNGRALGQALMPFVQNPTPPTKLAFDELAVAPTPRASIIAELVEDALGSTESDTVDLADETTEAPTTRAVLVADAIEPRVSQRPPPPASSPRRKSAHTLFENARTVLESAKTAVDSYLDQATKETKYVLIGAAVMLLATILIAATSGSKKPPSPTSGTAPVDSAFPTPPAAIKPAPSPTPTLAPAPSPRVITAPATSIVSPVVRPRPRPHSPDENPSLL